MSGKTYPPAPGWIKSTYIDNAKYLDLYARSIADPESFWAEQAGRIDWIKPFTRVKNTSFGPGSVSIKWFEDGTTNVAQNCIDRHLLRLENHTAIIWEGDDPEEFETYHLPGVARRGLPPRQCPQRRMASRRATRSRSICR